MDEKIKIMVVEEDDLYRSALKNLLSSHDHLEVVADADSGEKAIQRSEDHVKNWSGFKSGTEEGIVDLTVLMKLFRLILLMGGWTTIMFPA